MSFQPPEDPTPATEQMQTDIDAIKSGQAITSGVFAGYLSADFFIQALKKAGSNPTPEKVQTAASKMTFGEGADRPHEVPGLARHPDAVVRPIVR